MGRSLLKMSNNEIYESSLRFIFKQLDIYVEVNEKVNKNNKLNKNNKSDKNNRVEKIKLKVLD